MIDDQPPSPAAQLVWVVGADSATAALLSSGIAGLGIAGLAPDSKQWLAWAGLIALATAGMLAAAWVFRLGFLGDFLSTAVLIGFLAGTGATVFTGQIPDMLGIDGEDGTIIHRWWHIAGHLADTDPWALSFTVVTLGILLAAKRYAPKAPVALPVVVMIVLVGVTGWSDKLSATLLSEGILADLDPDHVFPTVGAAVRACEQAFLDGVGPGD